MLSQLKDLKSELSALRVAKVTGGAPNKLSKIKIVRKSIARVLTVYRQSMLTALKTKIMDDAKNSNGKVSRRRFMRVAEFCYFLSELHYPSHHDVIIVQP